MFKEELTGLVTDVEWEAREGAGPRLLQQVGTLTDIGKSGRALGKHFDECLTWIQNGPYTARG